MKIEFVKVTKIDGTIYYYTAVNEKFIDGTLELDEQKAYDKFNLVKQTGGSELKEVIETFDTELTPY